LKEKRDLWKIEEKAHLRIENIAIKVGDFVKSEAQLYTKAHSWKQAVWLFADRFAREAGVEHGQVYIDNAREAVNNETKKTHQEQDVKDVKTEWMKDIKRNRGKKKRKEETEKMFGRKKDDDAEEQMSFDF